MPVFEYKGLNGSGKTVSGMEDADSSRAARTRLKRQGIFVTEIHEQLKAGEMTRGKGLNFEIDFSKTFQSVGVQDVATMTSQMSTLVGAGVPVVEALGALVDQSENPLLRSILAKVREDINEGSTLAEALKSHPDVFSDLYINMVRAGEASGGLEVVLQRLADYTESQVELKNKLVAALTYPVLMTFVAGGIVLGLFTFVIPRIRTVFDSFDAKLPFITEVLLSVSDFTLAWWWLIILLAPASWFGFKRWIATEDGRLRWDRFKITMPLFGRINRLVAISRFCRTLSTLLNSGVPILNALAIVQSVVQNQVLAQAVSAAATNISEGQSIAVPLKESGEFPPIVTHMIAIGEKTGELETMLGKVADAYENIVDSIVNTLTSLLTPALTLLMGGVVALIAVAILLPMMEMSSIVR